MSHHWLSLLIQVLIAFMKCARHSVQEAHRPFFAVTSQLYIHPFLDFTHSGSVAGNVTVERVGEFPSAELAPCSVKRDNSQEQTMRSAADTNGLAHN